MVFTSILCRTGFTTNFYTGNIGGVIKRLAVAKKGIYDGLAAVEQAPNSELAKEYVAIAEMIMSGKEKREAYEHE